MRFFRWASLSFEFGYVPVFITLLSACSPINLQSAVALGNTGVRTANIYQQAISSISPGLDNFLQGQSMLAALNPVKYSPPGPQLIDSIRRVQAAVAARAVMLGQLVLVYQGLSRSPLTMRLARSKVHSTTSMERLTITQQR
jgi:hypothetical protein